jgi:soluble lytic murein transglycosylase
MPTLSKSAAILATAWFALAVVPAIAQEPPGKPAAKKAAPKSGGKVQAKSEAKKTEPKATATSAKAPETAEKPEPAHRPTEGELAHIARYDAAIAPVRDLALGGDEATSLRAALKAASQGDLADARAARDKVGDPAARKLVDWYLYRAGFGTAGEVRAFLDESPAWPDRRLLIQRSEEALFNSAASAAEIKAFFAGKEPTTAVGLAALASACLAEKDEARAKALAAKAWTDYHLPAGQEAAFLKRVGSLLSEADHKRRLDRLLFNDSRWIGERNERAQYIRRMLPLLSADEKKKVEARLAVFTGAKNSSQLIAKLPAEAQAEWGVAMQMA